MAPGSVRVMDDTTTITTPAAAAQRPGLTDDELTILDLERSWWKYVAVKEQAALDQLGLKPTRYYQILNALIDKPEALAADPLLVKRLRRLRSAREQQRSARRLNLGALR